MMVPWYEPQDDQLLQARRVELCFMVMNDPARIPVPPMSPPPLA